MRRPSKLVAALVGGAGALAVAAVVAGLLGVTATVVAGPAVAALLLFGVAATRWADDVSPGEPHEEERHVEGPDLRRRRLIAAAGAGAASVVAVTVAVPAARRASQASAALRRTSWRDGAVVVTAEGDPVSVSDLALGELVTVYPAGAVGAHDSQAVLIRESPLRLRPGTRHEWSPEGILAYSKLCTHMACPMGLYQQSSGVLLCPCHQATFDLLGGGRPVTGPARRALPQLPLAIMPDGLLVARGDFSDAVGTGFWGRP